MTLRSRAILAFLIAVVPCTLAFAAAPANVTGITASKEGNAVRVNWTAVTTPGVSAYRIFYSHASILEQNGLYDDFETAAGTATTFLLQNLPAGNEVYVSVLAVNDKGEESPLFTEEAKVMLREGVSSTSTSKTPASSNSTTNTNASGMLRALEAEATSPTEVTVTFSDTVNVSADKAVAAFTILSQGGASQLPATRLTVQGPIVKIQTQAQERNAAYMVKVGNVVTGTDKTGKPLALDPASATLLFSGHPNGVDAQVVAPTTQVQPGQLPSDVLNLRLRAQAETSGRYAIEAMWQPPTDASVIALQVFQTSDGGRTYSQPVAVTPTTAMISVPHVPAGSFGILVRSVTQAGAVSRGIMQLIDLPGAAPTQTNVTYGPTPQPKFYPSLPATVIKGGKSAHLPQSGPELLASLTLAGFGVLVKQSMRRKQAAA